MMMLLRWNGWCLSLFSFLIQVSLFKLLHTAVPDGATVRTQYQIKEKGIERKHSKGHVVELTIKLVAQGSLVRSECRTIKMCFLGTFQISYWANTTIAFINGTIQNMSVGYPSADEKFGSKQIVNNPCNSLLEKESFKNTYIRPGDRPAGRPQLANLLKNSDFILQKWDRVYVACT